jgi:hypothetical protein
MGDIYDPAFVKGVFDRCSDRYITFSSVCSFGFTERWCRQCVEAMPAVRSGARGYDLMAGTGEVWPHLLKRFDAISAVTAVDISSGMHRRPQGPRRSRFVERMKGAARAAQGFQPPLPYSRVMISSRCPLLSLKYTPRPSSWWLISPGLVCAGSAQ